MENADSDINNDFPFNHKKLHKTRSTSNISIENIKINQRKIRINSPRSLEAIKLLGYNVSQLEYLPFKDYIKLNPNLIAESKQMQQNHYDYIEKLRKERFIKIKKLREQLISEYSQIIDKRSQSCYNLKKGFSKSKRSKWDSESSAGDEAFGFTAIENEKKSLEKMKNKNEVEIMNKIQFELKRELARKKNEEKIEKQNLKLKEYAKKLNRKKREEEIAKKIKEEELLKKQQELELQEKELNKKKYNEAMQKAKEEQKREKQKIKEALLRHQEEEERRMKFQEKINKMLEDKHQKIVEKAKILFKKELERKKQMEKKNKEQQEMNLLKSMAKQEQIENTLKKNEQKQEEIRMQYIMKERENEEQRKRYEKQMKKENELKLLNAQKKEEEIKLILEKNEMLKQQKIDNYYEKQRILAMKREEMEKKNEIKKREREMKNEEKEQRIKDTLNKNEILLNERKNKIINDIKKRENNTQINWRKKKENQMRAQEENMEKKIDKEFRMKEIAQKNQNKINDTRMKLYDKDKKVENFLRQKHILNEQKKIFSEQVCKQKQLYSEKFDNIFRKKNIDEQTLTSIKNMFPDNKQISDIINELNELNKK